MTAAIAAPAAVPTGSAHPPHVALVPAPAHPRPGWVPQGRSIHLDDVENLMAGPQAGLHVLEAVRDQYAAILIPGPDDHVLSACNPRLVHHAATAWFPSRWLTRPGKDGADLALLDAVDADDVARRFYRVVIGSGDRAFTPLARQLRDRGIEVWVIARPGSLHWALGRAAHVVAFLPDAPDACNSQPTNPAPDTSLAA